MFNTITKMKKHLTNYSFLILLFSIFTGISLQAQNATLTSKILDGKSQAVEFATIALKSAIDSTLIKVEMTDENGIFTIQNIKPADYLLEITYVGLADCRKLINVSQGNNDLGSLNMDAGKQQIEEVKVTAQRNMIEAKRDRMVFNVQGTINSAGENLLNLLRKAPGVLVDNNDNISVLSRAGVLIYVDGKRLPLSGADLTAYLQSLPAEQVDHIDIITNPGAKYEAEGNAGIIDIILKRDKNHSLHSKIIQEMFNELEANNLGPSLEKIIDSYTTADWRSSFIQSPKLFNYLGNKRYVRKTSSHGFVLFKGERMSGAHAELYSYSFYLNHLEGNEFGPFVSGMS